MANKTQPTDVPVEEFIAQVEPARRREEATKVLALMRKVTGEDGTMWGPSIIGFGTYHYKTKAGAEGDWMSVGFSPRKAQFTFYGLKDSTEQAALLDRLGPHTDGVGCVYAKRVEDLDDDVLAELVRIGYGRGDCIA